MPARRSKSRRRSKRRRSRRSKRRRSKSRTRRSKRRNEYTATDMGDLTQSLLGQLPNPVYSNMGNTSDSPIITMEQRDNPLPPPGNDAGLGTDSDSYSYRNSPEGEALFFDPGASPQGGSEIFTELVQQPQRMVQPPTTNTRARPVSRPRSRSRSRSRRDHYSGARCGIKSLREGKNDFPWRGAVRTNGEKDQSGNFITVRNGERKEKVKKMFETVPKETLLYPYPIYSKPYGKKGENRNNDSYYTRGLVDVVYYTEYQITKFCNARRSGSCEDANFTYRRNAAQRVGRNPVRTKKITKGCEYYTRTSRGSVSGNDRQRYSDRPMHQRKRSRSRRRRSST